MKRRYRLSEDGRRRLQASIARTRPWKKSTGPRTGVGKARSARNATAHGNRSRARIAVVRLARALVRSETVCEWLTSKQRVVDADRELADAAITDALADALHQAETLVRVGDVFGAGERFLAWCHEPDRAAWLTFREALLRALSDAMAAGHDEALFVFARLREPALRGPRHRPRRR